MKRIPRLQYSFLVLYSTFLAGKVTAVKIGRAINTIINRTHRTINVATKSVRLVNTVVNPITPVCKTLHRIVTTFRNTRLHHTNCVAQMLCRPSVPLRCRLHCRHHHRRFESVKTQSFVRLLRHHLLKRVVKILTIRNHQENANLKLLEAATVNLHRHPRHLTNLIIRCCRLRLQLRLLARQKRSHRLNHLSKWLRYNLHPRLIWLLTCRTQWPLDILWFTLCRISFRRRFVSLLNFKVFLRHHRRS